MLKKYLNDCEEITAGDRSTLREFLHPDKADLPIHYSLAHAKVKPGKTTKPHRLKSSEVYYILSGKGLMQIDEQSFEVSDNCVIYIPPHSMQYIENTGSSELKFLCIVEPAWQKEDEEVFNS
jgi:mannose-6-phosphate isomerase-like protein (cupin superfamily)